MILDMIFSKALLRTSSSMMRMHVLRSKRRSQWLCVLLAVRSYPKSSVADRTAFSTGLGAEATSPCQVHVPLTALALPVQSQPHCRPGTPPATSHSMKSISSDLCAKELHRVGSDTTQTLQHPQHKLLHLPQVVRGQPASASTPSMQTSTAQRHQR